MRAVRFEKNSRAEKRSATTTSHALKQRHGKGGKNKLTAGGEAVLRHDPTTTKNGKEDDLDGTAPMKHDLIGAHEDAQVLQ